MATEKMQLVAHNLADLPAIAQKILGLGKKKMFFYGDLGAGKTALITALCHALQVSDQPASPTFSIVNVYHSPQGEVYHADLYRMKSTEEALAIGVLDMLDNENYFFVEWPQFLEPFANENTLYVSLGTEKEESRKIEIIF